MQVETFDVCDIRLGKRLRQADADKVGALAASITAIGLRTPITVRVLDNVADEDGVVTDGVPYLVTGLHRLEAVRQLGWEKIDAIVSAGDETDARLWEIAENLHRADLTAQERSDQIAEWVRLVSDKLSETPSSSGGRPGAAAAASRALGVNEREVQRAVKMANLAPEAKRAAKDVGLDDNQSALLAAAKESDPVAQVDSLLQHARQLEAREAARQAARQAEDVRKEAREQDKAIAHTAAEEFASWLMERTDLNEMPTIISWLEGTKAKDVIAALRREAA
jgi:ParB family chromosome partitioning protein